MSQGIRFDGSLIATSSNPGARRGCLKFPCGGDNPMRAVRFLRSIQSGCDGNASCLPRPDRDIISLLEAPPVSPFRIAVTRNGGFAGGVAERGVLKRLWNRSECHI